MEYSVIEGKKLNSKNYESEGFRYVKTRECEGSIYIKCALFRTNSCPCIGRIDKATNLMNLTHIHNHDTASYNDTKIILSNSIKRKAEVSTASLREIFNETCRESDGASSVTFRSLGSSMYKRRRTLQPKLPVSVQEFDILLKESQYFDYHLQTVIDADQMAFVFGSNHMIDMLKDTSDTQFDGTFKVVPRLFYQLFTIFINVKSHSLPGLHILMTGKTEKLYRAVMITIRILIPGFNPAFAIGDFEQAPRNALTDIFPSVTIIGCWFHFTKAVFEKVKKLGLSRLYKTNQLFRIWIRKLMALPFLPEEHIRHTYLSLDIPLADLLDSEKELVHKFKSYFNKFWINGNANLSVFYYEKATNNGAESYHKSLKSYIRVPHPNIWKFMASLNDVISDNDIELQRLMEGLDTTRGPNSYTKTKTDRRNFAKEKYLNGSFSELEYLDAITLTIGRGDLGSGHMSSKISNTLEDSLDVSTDNEEEHSEKCHVCLLPRS